MWMQAVLEHAGFTQIGVRMLDRAIELGEPGRENAITLNVPKTNPILLQISRGEQALTCVQWQPGQTQVVPVGPGPITIQTLVGDAYRLRTINNAIPIAYRASETGINYAYGLWRDDLYDVCIICATFEEAQAFLDVLKTHGALPKEEFSQQLQRDFFSATIQNNVGEPLTIFITWAPEMGGQDIGTELGRILNAFSIRFVAMTGICAGNKRYVKLGDLVVVDSTYLHDSGSYVSTPDGNSKHLFNTGTIQASPIILHAVRGFEGWKDEGLQFAKPASKRQQRDWLLSTLLEKKTIYNINLTELDTYAPQWRAIVQELKQGQKPFLDEKLQVNEEMVMDLLYGPEEFPYHDPLAPRCYIGSMASGNSVRKDNPFPSISQPVNKVLALDMECWAFYNTLKESNVHALFVKGVCDYGDGNKDDSYHQYAATLSAIYMHSFIKKFVTQERIPLISRAIRQTLLEMT
jgi:nucleoside phosphorylase